MPLTRDYREAANRYRPASVRVLFIAESPPAYKRDSDKSYFYFEENPGSDLLFATVVEALYSADYRKSDGNKPALLRQFQNDGYFLMDAVEVPINRVHGRKTSPSERKSMIRAGLPSLLERLHVLRRQGVLSRRTGIILIKKIVFEILAGELSRTGYGVLQREKIDFPKYYRDRDTVAGIRKALDYYVAGNGPAE